MNIYLTKYNAHCSLLFVLPLVPQFGIPPETIKDSMVLGLGVPSVYIVPVERFCREMGPALGVNLAEFEFPAYFNFFVQRKRCTLIVDSDDAEKNIRRVFSETLLGPAHFRREENPVAYEPEDFADTYPKEAIPDFHKEFKHFRVMPDGKELVLETLLKFNHFRIAENGAHEGLGVPPILIDEPDLEERLLSSAVQIGSIPEDSDADADATAAAVLAAALQRQRSDGALVEDNMRSSYIKSQQAVASDSAPAAESSGSDLRKVALKLEKEEKRKTWSYSQAKWIGDVATIYPEDATTEQIEAGTTKRVEVFSKLYPVVFISSSIYDFVFAVNKSTNPLHPVLSFLNHLSRRNARWRGVYSPRR